jgi:hypothetical protein
MGNILKIIERTPKQITLKDGFYKGVWGGNCIVMKYKDKEYELTTEEGVRGVGYEVVVLVKDGKTNFYEIEN